MHQNFRGEIIYNEEIDKHFPNLTVGETLEFAAGCRTPQNRFNGISRKEWITSVTQVAMTVLGLSHTYNTKVGNDFIHGVSGGERKRVSIAEVFLAGSPIVAWDNSTRGLDASTALKFVKSVRIVANLSLSCHAIAIYQASQRIYDEFDKATVLYEGRQIYFGPANIAKDYFQSMGWYWCVFRGESAGFLK
jgi:ATP-binding cassette subfamily G (WHITE) protein 2 (PDR)